MDDSPLPTFDATTNMINDRLNEVEVEVITPRAAMFVFNDSWAPGWKAYVDGVERPALRVNYAFRGVVVPEGPHRVVFVYRPQFFFIGLAVSVLSLLLLVLFSLRSLARIRYRSLANQTTATIHN